MQLWRDIVRPALAAQTEPMARGGREWGVMPSPGRHPLSGSRIRKSVYRPGEGGKDWGRILLLMGIIHPPQNTRGGSAGFDGTMLGGGRTPPTGMGYATGKESSPCGKYSSSTKYQRGGQASKNGKMRMCRRGGGRDIPSPGRDPLSGAVVGVSVGVFTVLGKVGGKRIFTENLF